MSMVLTPLQPIGMNGGGVHAPKRRSARLSAEGAEDSEDGFFVKRSKAMTTTVGTKVTDGEGTVAAAKRKKRGKILGLSVVPAGAAGAAGRADRKAGGSSDGGNDEARQSYGDEGMLIMQPLVYDEDADGFAFSKSKKPKAKAAPAVRTSHTRDASPPADSEQPRRMAPPPVPFTDDAVSRTARRKTLKRLPSTPERDAADKTVRRSKRLSNEGPSSDDHSSPHRLAHARSHAKSDRSPNSEKARPLTVEKKRKRGADGVEEEKVMRIQLPFADTPVIKRNKEMRKASAENGSRRSSSGMRGRRASSLIEDGRGNGESNTTSPRKLRSGATEARQVTAKAPSTRLSTHHAPAVETTRSNSELRSDKSGLETPPSSGETSDEKAPTNPAQASADNDALLPALPHSEVPATEFYKHISADLTEPRRMRCLLGWCGTRMLPAKPEAPKDSPSEVSSEFQALQAARVIQAELSQDLVTKGTLSDWFSRDDEVAPAQAPLRKKPNPRNAANAAKAEELERELERLKKERAEWDELIASATKATPALETNGDLSPLHPELLDTPQRKILGQVQAPEATPADPNTIAQRMRNVSENLEFTVDQFAHGIHALTVSKDTGDRLAQKSLGDAAMVLGQREMEGKAPGKGVDAFDALKGLARVLNSGRR